MAVEIREKIRLVGVDTKDLTAIYELKVEKNRLVAQQELLLLWQRLLMLLFNALFE